MKNSFYTLIFWGLLSTTISAQVTNVNTNLGVGTSTLGNTSTTIRNVAFGNYALTANTNTKSNNAVGYKALNVNTKGYFNTAMGSFSMFKNTTGESNTAVGHKSLYLNNSGANNVALGYESLYSNLDGWNNTAVGSKSLRTNASNDNSVFGYEGLQFSTGFANNAFGAFSLHSLTSGDENIAFGYLAGHYITSGMRNIIIGTYNGSSGSSNYNITIGWKSGTQSNGDNNIIIGKRVSLAPGISNAMNIGGVLFGKGFKSDESAWAVPANGQIGINVIDPTATLDVAGNAKISSTLIANNIGIGCDPGTGQLKVYGAENPSIVLSGPTSRLIMGIATCTGCYSVGANVGDAVITKLGSSHNTLLTLSNDNNDGNSYIGFGDDANGIWVKIFNNKMMRVNGTITATEVTVKTDVWADYVFKPSYKLMPLNQVEQFVKTNNHLPEIPSAAEVQKDGLSLGEMQNKLLQKVEELTLYMIEQQKTINQQNAKIEELEKKLK
jgi:hypothetical protein